MRDIYVRGKYRDIILPLTVIRRLDALLEPSKGAVLAIKKRLDDAGIVNQEGALRDTAGHAFYNTSPYTLRDLKARAKQQQLKADFEAYLDGFSPNVQDILEKFEFRNQIPRMIKADILGSIIEKFLDTSINLSPKPVLNSDGSIHLPGLDNHDMGMIFEELIRRFNEENNEEAGEHFTPRDVVTLMADLIFMPIADQIESGNEMFTVLNELESKNLWREIERLDRALRCQPKRYKECNKYVSQALIPLYLAEDREDSKEQKSHIEDFLKPFYKHPDKSSEILFNILDKLICYDQSSIAVDLCKKTYAQIAKSLLAFKPIYN